MNQKQLPVKHVFTYYLPQYHEIKENNEWWGEGFTEWVNVRGAKQFNKYQEIHYPSELGYYTLDNSDIIEKQYKLAKDHGIDTFCFWHYWFDDNEMLLEKPAELLLNSNSQVEFCFSWANHSWYNKTKNCLLKEQKYDYSLKMHFEYLLPFFKDKRYRKINNKPVFVIYNSKECPNYSELKSYFNKKAVENGFDGVFLILENTNETQFSSLKGDCYLNSCRFLKFRNTPRKIVDKILYKLDINFGLKIPRFYDYEKCVNELNRHIEPNSKEMPIVFPNWDSTIRHSKGGVCLLNSTPETFKLHLEDVSNILTMKPESDRLLMVKSWNEWAEGNFIEPSAKYGRQYLEAFAKVFTLVDKNQ